ncbi:hypothetical protein EIN_065000 [Entamoeba invadens IP1]|uniref:Uncharacterized protein n=1 Tax=Entamoeba invadens IP1 TaxID=370355 RepID=A0A0A1TXK5_ENTIV|nr:hypothetical protein EIN_065000 [Entamoeba invadens IP1]ELP84255.1 hypothetical protein EIN_065000 [Entamoeba invadens IP1]|eukprot:XP_004183601.1 hypothetical protein EIN_065000 [Entamoeba invadens IP1]
MLSVTNKVAFIDVKPGEFEQIIKILETRIHNGRLQSEPIRAFTTKVTATSPYLYTLHSKYGTATLELVPMSGIPNGKGNEWGGYVCDETTARFESIKNFCNSELCLVIGDGKQFDWCIDNSIEYVNRQDVGDESNAEGIDRIAEAIVNSPWSYNTQPDSTQKEEKVVPETVEDKKSPLSSDSQQNKIENDNFEMILMKLVQYKQKASTAKTNEERRKYAEEAALIMAQYLGDSESDSEQQ